MFIDSHCHLDSLKTIQSVIERAEKKKVRVILTNGVDSKSNKKSLDLSKQFEAVKAVLGIYPDIAEKLSDKEVKEEIEFVKKNKKHVSMIGECGLDFKESSGKNVKKQEKVFKKMIVLSMDLGLPITVHSRKAEERCIEILEEMKAKKVIMHYFSGKMKLVDRIIKNNWVLTIPTAVKHSEHFQKVIERTPVENLLCETDSPYSHPDKKFPNEPANVIESYKMIAKIKKLKLKDVEKQLEDNFKRLC